MQKNSAVKFDKEKASLDLLPVQAKRAIAEVFDFGAKKYARHNWRSGFNYSRLIAAAERHLDAFNDGEDLDPESGKSHLAHLGCCVMMLLEHTIKGYGTDDRFKPDALKNVGDELHMPSNDFEKVVKSDAPTIAVGAWKENDFSSNDIVKISEQMSGLNESAKKIQEYLENTHITR